MASFGLIPFKKSLCFSLVCMLSGFFYFFNAYTFYEKGHKRYAYQEKKWHDTQKKAKNIIEKGAFIQQHQKEIVALYRQGFFDPPCKRALREDLESALYAIDAHVTHLTLTSHDQEGLMIYRVTLAGSVSDDTPFLQWLEALEQNPWGCFSWESVALTREAQASSEHLHFHVVGVFSFLKP